MEFYNYEEAVEYAKLKTRKTNKKYKVVVRLKCIPKICGQELIRVYGVVRYNEYLDYV